MRNKFLSLLFIAGLTALASCFGQHNNAPNKGVNLDDERIYGEKGKPARQIANQYPDDTTSAARAQKIRETFYPR